MDLNRDWMKRVTWARSGDGVHKRLGAVTHGGTPMERAKPRSHPQRLCEAYGACEELHHASIRMYDCWWRTIRPPRRTGLGQNFNGYTCPFDPEVLEFQVRLKGFRRPRGRHQLRDVPVVEPPLFGKSVAESTMDNIFVQMIIQELDPGFTSTDYATHGAPAQLHRRATHCVRLHRRLQRSERLRPDVLRAERAQHLARDSDQRPSGPQCPQAVELSFAIDQSGES